jgi:hypothetical protein
MANGVSVEKRRELVTALDGFIADFRQAALDAIDVGCNPPDMLNIGLAVANSRANKRAAERERLTDGVGRALPIFSRN